MHKWTGNSRRYSFSDPLDMDDPANVDAMFSGGPWVPVVAPRRPSTVQITPREAAGAIAFALLIGLLWWAGTVVALTWGK